MGLFFEKKKKTRTIPKIVHIPLELCKYMYCMLPCLNTRNLDGLNDIRKRWDEREVWSELASVSCDLES